MKDDDFLPLTTQERLNALCQALRVTQDDLDSPPTHRRLHRRLDDLLDLHYQKLSRIASLKLRVPSDWSLLTKRPAGMGQGEENDDS